MSREAATVDQEGVVDTSVGLEFAVVSTAEGVKVSYAASVLLVAAIVSTAESVKVSYAPLSFDASVLLSLVGVSTAEGADAS